MPKEGAPNNNKPGKPTRKKRRLFSSQEMAEAAEATNSNPNDVPCLGNSEGRSNMTVEQMETRFAFDYVIDKTKRMRRDLQKLQKLFEQC